MAPSRELWDHNEPQDYLEELDEQKQVLKMTESEIRSFCGKTAFLFVFPNPIPVIQTEDSSPEGSEELDSLIPPRSQGGHSKRFCLTMIRKEPDAYQTDHALPAHQ